MTNKGLSKESVILSRKKYGSNEIEVHKKNKFLSLLLESLGDPIIKILLIALAIKIVFLFQDFDFYETIGIFIAVFLATFISTISEYGSEKAFEKLGSEASHINVRVKRSGVVTVINISEVVVGDIVLLESGDLIPADGILLEGNISVDESILTGESLSVTKEIEKIKSEVTLADRKNMIYAGTTVTTGRAIGVITGIGIHTEIGKIASNVVSKKDEASPLTIRMNEFSKQISICVIFSFYF